MIKKIAAHLIISNVVIFLFLNFFFGSSMAKSFLFSSMLLLTNFIGLALMWMAVLKFKKISFVTLAAVIKYPLIGLSIYWAGRQAWINMNGIVIGICSFLIIIVVNVLLNFKSQKH